MKLVPLGAAPKMCALVCQCFRSLETEGSSAEAGTSFRMEGGEGNGTRAATASSSPEPLQALMLLTGGATHFRPRE